MKKILFILNFKPRNPVGYDWATIEAQIVPSIADASVTIVSIKSLVFDLTLNNPRVYHADDGYDITDFDFVIFRTVGAEFERAVAAAHYLSYKGVPFTDTYLLTEGKGKLASAFNLLESQIASPRTIYARPQRMYNLFSSGSLSLPIIIKADIGRKGDDNYLINSLDQLKNVLEDCNRRGVEVIAQEYIKSNGDYRILIMGGAVKLIIHRKIVGDTHLSNTSKGATAELVDIAAFDQSILDTAVRAAERERVQVAGVDIIVNHETGDYYILEVNRAPQLSRGAFVDDKLHVYSDFINEQIRKLT